MRAADLFEHGVIPAEIARRVGVSHQIVSDWRAAWRREGRDGLRAAVNLEFELLGLQTLHELARLVEDHHVRLHEVRAYAYDLFVRLPRLLLLLSL